MEESDAQRPDDSTSFARGPLSGCGAWGVGICHLLASVDQAIHHITIKKSIIVTVLRGSRLSHRNVACTSIAGAGGVGWPSETGEYADSGVEPRQTCQQRKPATEQEATGLLIVVMPYMGR
jgi:hypothetical protein